MKRARRPPLHPNCRSTLIPVVDLIDPKTGEKIEETAERPAQNADGTYSQVAAKTTFKDYFESQPETFQREWLGEKRFELWKSGKLKFEDLAKPATSYRATTADLTPPTEKPKETAASDDKPNNTHALLADAIRKVGGEDAAAEILRRYAADSKKRDGQTSEGTPQIWGLTANGENPVETLRRLRAAAIGSRRAALDGVLPPANGKAENREKMQQRYQVGSGVLKVGRGPKAPPMARKIEEKVFEGLDFIGRLLDYIGIDNLDAKFWETEFYPNCFGDGKFDAHDNKIRLRDWGLENLGANVAHEYAHALERHAPDLRKHLYRLYVDLTTEEDQKRTPLTPAFNKDGKLAYYNRPLAARFAKMNVPQYALKTYEGTEENPPTELFSTWCQELCDNPQVFVKKQRVFFEKVLEVLNEWKEM